MTPDVASERSIFSKNHDCNSYIEFSVSRTRGEHVRTYILGCRCMRWQKTIREQTHTHTRGTATVTIIMKSTKVQTLGGNIGTFGLETPNCMHMY